MLHLALKATYEVKTIIGHQIIPRQGKEKERDDSVPRMQGGKTGSSLYHLYHGEVEFVGSNVLKQIQKRLGLALF